MNYRITHLTGSLETRYFEHYLIFAWCFWRCTGAGNLSGVSGHKTVRVFGIRDGLPDLNAHVAAPDEGRHSERNPNGLHRLPPSSIFESINIPCSTHKTLGEWDSGTVTATICRVRSRQVSRAQKAETFEGENVPTHSIVRLKQCHSVIVSQ